MSSQWTIIWQDIENRGLTFHAHAIEGLETDDDRDDITHEMVEETVNNPEEIFVGVTGRSEYRKAYGKKRLNVVVADEDDLIVSVHWIT